MRAAALMAAVLPFGACSVLSDWTDPSEPPSRLSSTAAALETEGASFPNLGSVPGEAPAVSPPAQRREIVEGLVADRANAEYTDLALRPGAAPLAPESQQPRVFSIAPESGSESLAAMEEQPSAPSGGASDAAEPEAGAAATIAAAQPSESAPAPTAPAVTPPPEVPEVPPSPVPELLDDTSEAPPAPAGRDDTAEPTAPRAQPESNSAEAAASDGVEVAALPPEGEALPETRLLFDQGSAELSATAQSELAALAARLLQNDQARIQLLAYASSDEAESSYARRLSLSRAIAVRRFLIDHGVPSTRMDVRALGDRTESEPVDRVDIIAGS